MKKLLYCENLYQDIESLFQLISPMEYEQNIYGEEIINFNFMPQGLEQQFETVMGESLEIQPNTGVFRKPSNIIHFENFYQHALWLCIVALEDTQLRIYEQEEVKTFFDVKDNLDDFVVQNCMDESKWTTQTQINIKKNGFVFIRPWLWHSLEKNKLVQIFLLNHKIKEQ
jgi:hypothetical protein